MSSNVDIVEIGPMKKGSPVVVTGFAGAGFIGNTALMYIASEKGFIERAQLKSHLIPPMFLLVEGRPIPVFRIYGNKKNDVLLVVSDALINAENAWPIGIGLMEWLREKGVKEIISIEGMPFATPKGTRPILGFSLPMKDFIKVGVRPTSEGGISGLNAVLLDEAMKHKVPWTSLLVPTGTTQSIDYVGTADLIETLNRILKLGVDTSILRQSGNSRREAVRRARTGKQKGLLGGLRRQKPGSGS
jgi:predicted ATP-grasp superfamily ATP-dependent carboligase